MITRSTGTRTAGIDDNPDGERHGVAPVAAPRRVRAALPLVGLLLLTAAMLLGGRAWVGVGWSAQPRPRPNGEVSYGIPFNANDNLSYVAWAQQGRLGRWGFLLPYTTEPLRGRMINPFMLAVGRAARLTGAHPILVLNLCGFVAALGAVAFLYLAARSMGLTRRGAFLAGLLAAAGSGLSWLSIILNLKYGIPAPLGADFRGYTGYYDLIPSAAFVVYPYHSVGFCLVALLLWCIGAAERAAEEKRRMMPWMIVLALGAAALAGVRPYEPVAFAAVLGLYALAGQVRGWESARIRWITLAVLATTASPFVLHSFWLSRQPFWRDFAANSLSLANSRVYWLIGFGLFWPLALAGALLARRARGVNLGLAAAWAAFLFVILLVLDVRQSKLAAGGMLSLCLLAGYAWDRIFGWIGGLARARRMAWGAVAVFVLAAMGGTLIAFYLFLARITPTVSPELIQAGRAMERRAGGKLPNVLTDTANGALLPGLAGARVYAGHPAFLAQNDPRERQLVAAGLQRGEGGKLAEPTMEALDRLLGKEAFDFVLAERNCPGGVLLTRHPNLKLIYGGNRLMLFEVRQAP